MLLTSGALLGLAYPPNPVGGLFAALGLVPLLIAMERATSLGQVIRWNYGAFLLFSAISTWWVGSWQTNSDPWLMTSAILLIIIHPFFFVLPIVLYWYVRRATSYHFGLIFLPLLWCGGEYLHALTDASYPWLTLGNTQTYNLYYIQFTELTGVWGVSLLLLIQNSIIAWFLISAMHGVRTAAKTRRMMWIGLTATVVLPYLHGVIALMGESNAELNSYERMTITVVQPNQNPWDKWRQDDPVDHILDNAEASFQALHNGEKPDLFLWAENAIPYPVTHPNQSRRRNELFATIDSLGVPVMTGFPDYVRHASKEDAAPSSKRDTIWGPGREQFTVEYWDFYNSIGTFTPDGELLGAYHKSQLVPFGERIPFVDAVPFLIDMLSWDVGISAWGKGDGAHTIAAGVLPNGDSIHAGAMVCFESVYPNMVRQFADQGAQFLTIVTNDGWYLGTPGPLQHERFAILRAIETRRWIARAANTGISCFVNPRGEIIGETAEGVRTTTTATVSLRNDKTLYVRLGDWLPILCLLGAGAMGAIAIVRRRSGSAS